MPPPCGLLQTREAIANQLAIYQNNGFLVLLFADAAPGILAALRSAARPSTRFSVTSVGRDRSRSYVFRCPAGRRLCEGHHPLPPFGGVNMADSIPAIRTLKVSITDLQTPLSGSPLGASPFNEGPWVELATPYPLAWQGHREFIHVAERIFPTKLVIKSTKGLTAWMDPASGIIFRRSKSTPPVRHRSPDGDGRSRSGW
jgi:hypothetical protein